MEFLGSSLRASQSLKEKQGSLRSLSSQLVMGTVYRIFFPLTNVQDMVDIRVVSVPGCPCDFEKIRTSFFVLPKYHVSDAGKIIDDSGILPYVRIARVLHKAAAITEVDDAKFNAEREAAKLGTEIDTASLNEKIKTINLEYFGDMEAKPKPISPTKVPFIRNVSLKTFTEVLVVPMTSDSKPRPQWEKKFLATLELSTRKTNQLLSIMAEPGFVDSNSDYLEVSYDYGRNATTKQQAGQDATFQGLSAEMRLSAIAPDSWAVNKSALDNIAKNVETMASRNAAISLSPSADEIVARIKNYVSKEKLILSSIDVNDEDTKKAVNDFIDTGIVAGVKSVQEKLLALVKQDTTEDNTVELPEGTSSEDFTKVAEAKSLTELADVTEAIDKLASADIDVI